VLRVDPSALDQLLHPTLDPAAPRQVIAKGLPASPGLLRCRRVPMPTRPSAMPALGEKVILIRTETSPEDIHGMHAARAF
jgi:pyruvate,orthophosphate dikinase